MLTCIVPFPASVFDLIPKDDIRKLEAVKEAAKMAASRFHSAGTTSENNNDLFPTPKESSVTNQSPPRDDERLGTLAGERTEQTASFPGSFAMKPFQKDPAKQDRYDRYLALVKHGAKGEPAAKLKDFVCELAFLCLKPAVHPMFGEMVACVVQICFPLLKARGFTQGWVGR